MSGTDPCAHYTRSVWATLVQAKLPYSSDGPLIAGLIRTCAEYAAGPCSIRHATDASFIAVGGHLTLWFETQEQIQVFRANIHIYLSPKAQDAFFLTE